MSGARSGKPETFGWQREPGMPIVYERPDGARFEWIGMGRPWVIDSGGDLGYAWWVAANNPVLAQHILVLDNVRLGITWMASNAGR